MQAASAERQAQVGTHAKAGGGRGDLFGEGYTAYFTLPSRQYATRATFERCWKGGGGGKTKTKADNSQTESGLPAWIFLCILSLGEPQDLWGSTAFAAEDLAAEQLAQSRSNATGKLTKRIAGNVKTKMELSTALAT